MQVTLAGPVAEMICTGDPYHPGLDTEWAADWRDAWEAAAPLHADERKRLEYLEQVSIQRYHRLKRDDLWAALASLADNLLHQTHLLASGVSPSRRQPADQSLHPLDNPLRTIPLRHNTQRTQGEIMASSAKRVSENVPGDFFVDTTCIDCDACRQIAPAYFGEAADTSFVKRQPVTSDERRAALYALLSCPTGSIGCAREDDPKAVMGDFPLLIEEPVFYCGFNSPKSYGGNSYFIRHPAGNWLIDSPKFVSPLVQRLEELGGISQIFLTHQDDVADAARYAEHFGAKRIIDRRELDSQPDAEVVLNSDEPTPLTDDFLVIPTPGHTEGHCCLLFDSRFLFTGDHLSWNRDEKRLAAFRNYCWYSWEVQTVSMSRLAQHQFEWVLPGHGQRVHLPAGRMAYEMQQLVEAMRE